MTQRKLPEKYKTCDWLRNYGSIGLTKEHIKRLNNAINLLESVYEYTDAKYLKEIKDKLLEDKPEPKIVKINTDAFIEKACEWLKEYGGGYWRDDYDLPTDELVNDFRHAMKGVIMETNEAPEKLYISYERYGVFGEDGSTERTKNSQIEYTRTDAFIEKATEWLKKNADNYTWYDETEGESGLTDDFINDFKNHMKGE